MIKWDIAVKNKPQLKPASTCEPPPVVCTIEQEKEQIDGLTAREITFIVV